MRDKCGRSGVVTTADRAQTMQIYDEMAVTGERVREH